MYRRIQFSILIMVLALVGCKTNDAHKADRTVQVMNEKFVLLKGAPDHIAAVTNSLNALVEEGGDMQAEFDTFDRDINNLVSHREQFRKLKGSVDSSRSAFTEAWAERHLTIKSDELRNRSKERRAKVIARFDEVNELVVDAKTEFQPWLEEVIDIRTYLESDLNPGGVASIADVASRASKNAEKVKSKIEKLITELEKHSKELTPPKPPKEQKSKKAKESSK